MPDQKEQAANYIRLFWRDNEGPLENIFRLSTYLMPVIPQLGWMVFIIDKVASILFHYSVEDFGRYLDQTLGLRTIDDFNMFPEKAEELVASKIKEASYNQHNMKKEAAFGISAILKLLKLKTLLKAFTILKKAAIFAATALIGTQVGKVFSGGSANEQLSEKKQGLDEYVSGLKNKYNLG